MVLEIEKLKNEDYALRQTITKLQYSNQKKEKEIVEVTN